MTSPLQSAFTDLPQSEDAQVRAVFAAMNAGPGYCPEATCALVVRWARALVKAGVIAGGVRE